MSSASRHTPTRSAPRYRGVRTGLGLGAVLLAYLLIAGAAPGRPVPEPSDSRPALAFTDLTAVLETTPYSPARSGAAAVTVGEAGRVNITQSGSTQWHTISLSRSYTRPIVVAGPVSYNGAQPTTVRVRSVTSTSFQVQLDEWDYLDGAHAQETISYVVIEAGRYTLEDGRAVEAGTVTAGGAFQTVGFSSSFGAAPTVVSQVVTASQAAAVVTRHRNTTTTGFEVRVQAQELATSVGSETVAYIAIPPGTGTNGGQPYQVGRTSRAIDHYFRAVSFSAGFGQVPTFVATMQSFYGLDPATLRYQNLTTSGVSAKVEEEQSKDTEVTHTTEVVGFLAFIPGPITGTGSTSTRPRVTGTSPADGATGVKRDTYVAADVYLPNTGQGIDPNTLTSSTVKLYPSGNPTAIVAANLNTSAAGDAITLQPTSLLASHTPYTFEVTSGLKDMAGNAFEPYTMSFTTGSQPNGSGSMRIVFERVLLNNVGGKHTSLVIGPDGKLYASTVKGYIKRWTINADGTLSNPQTIHSLRNAEGGDRMAIGLVFDPASTASNLVAWVSHTTYGFNSMPDWGGKITRLSGPNLENVQHFVVNLPRSIRDHVTNSLAFGPDGALYVNQGSNTATGAPDDAWGNRPERLLSSAVLRVDVAALKTRTLPLDVKTTDGGGTYNPYASGAPVKLFATGLRNAYDLVWHSNGSLYVPTNGSAANGKAPASVNGTLRPDGTLYNGPAIPAIDSIDTRSDYLFRIPSSPGYVYYGHPNPSRGEYVLDGGNPTSYADPAEVLRYPVGVAPDVKWKGFAYNFGRNVSPNGVIEYKSNAFNGKLKGKLLVVRYSGGDDILGLTLDKNGAIPSDGDFAIVIKDVTTLADPLELVENPANGNLYVSEYGGTGRIILLRPSSGDSQVLALTDSSSTALDEVEGLASVATEEGAVPQAYALSQNYPNPFNPVTTIRYDLPEAASVRLEVFDVTGRRVAVLVEGTRTAGYHQVDFDASTLPSGVYLCRLQAGPYTATRKMLFMK